MKRLLRILRTGTDSFVELATLYTGCLVVSATLFSYFEKQDWFSSLWWSIVTALTIGYGDLYPKTVGGRVVGVFLMHMVTLFIIPIIVARMATKLIASKNEFTDKEQKELKKMIKDIHTNIGTKK